VGEVDSGLRSHVAEVELLGVGSGKRKSR